MLRRGPIHKHAERLKELAPGEVPFAVDQVLKKLITQRIKLPLRSTEDFETSMEVMKNSKGSGVPYLLIHQMNMHLDEAKLDLTLIEKMKKQFAKHKRSLINSFERICANEDASISEDARLAHLIGGLCQLEANIHFKVNKLKYSDDAITREITSRADIWLGRSVQDVLKQLIGIGKFSGFGVPTANHLIATSVYKGDYGVKISTGRTQGSLRINKATHVKDDIYLSRIQFESFPLGTKAKDWIDQDYAGITGPKEIAVLYRFSGDKPAHAASHDKEAVMRMPHDLKRLLAVGEGQYSVNVLGVKQLE